MLSPLQINSSKLADKVGVSGIDSLNEISDETQFLSDIASELRPLEEQLRSKEPIYIFGAKRNASKMIRYCDEHNIEVAGLIDNDSKKQGTKFEQYSVLPLNTVDQEHLIVNSSGRFAIEISEQMRAAGYQNFWNMAQFMYVLELPFQAHTNFCDFTHTLFQKREKLNELYSVLGDDKSRQVLDANIAYRLTLDERVFEDSVSSYDEEFFDPDLLKLPQGSVFVDGGAYDGDSLERFIKMCPQFKAAYLYEPDIKLLDRASEIFSDYDSIFYRAAGLYSHSTELYFEATGDMDGSFSDEKPADSHKNVEKLKVVAIDEDVHHNATLLKIDIEGAEESALNGARKLITRDRPIIAIAAYHKPSDLVDLWQMIMEMVPDYNVYLRHYSHTVDDAILYFCPSDQGSHK